MRREFKILSSVMAVAVAAALACTACSKEEGASSAIPSDATPLVVYAKVGGSGSASTRAVTSDSTDMWSYVGFSTDDRMGFYASGGNVNADNGNGPFDNQELVFESGSNQFRDPKNGTLFSPTHMDGSQIFMYFPYDANIGFEPGMQLRRRAEDGDTERCIDLLTSKSLNILGGAGKDMALYGEFRHAFGELIILRGEGFDAPPKGCERITAVINNPYTHVRVVLGEESWSCTPALGYDPNTLISNEARQWDAWQGKNYGKTNTDSIGEPAWYVILPTMDDKVSSLDYIELYDNEGFLQRVSSIRLSDNSKNVRPGWRYPLKITMKELVPTVNPFPIQPWEEDENSNLTDERKRGINNLTEFQNWVRDYNSYLADPAPADDKTDKLLAYGDKIVDGTGNISWHFYVLSDLDLSGYQALPYLDATGSEQEPSTDVIIPELKDILDGISTTFVNGKFTNHKISGLNKTFVGTLGVNASDQTNGSVQNFDFIEPNVTNSETSEDPAGIIVNTMTNASVVNCRITDGDLFNPGGPAGMVAGLMTDGSIKECILSGSLVGKTTTADKIVGKMEGTPVFDKNNAAAVVVKNE